MSKVLVFVRLGDTNEPGAYIVPGVEKLRVTNREGEGDNDDVNVEIEATKGTDKYSITVQTVGRWVQAATDPDEAAARQFLQQNSATALTAGATLLEEEEEEEEEEGFYKLLLHDKNGLVVVREAPPVQRLNHREHSSLPNSSSVLSKLQILRRTATRVRV